MVAAFAPAVMAQHEVVGPPSDGIYQQGLIDLRFQGFDGEDCQLDGTSFVCDTTFNGECGYTITGNIGANTKMVITPVDGAIDVPVCQPNQGPITLKINNGKMTASTYQASITSDGKNPANQNGGCYLSAYGSMGWLKDGPESFDIDVHLTALWASDGDDKCNPDPPPPR